MWTPSFLKRSSWCYTMKLVLVLYNILSFSIPWYSEPIMLMWHLASFYSPFYIITILAFQIAEISLFFLLMFLKTFFWRANNVFFNGVSCCEQWISLQYILPVLWIDCTTWIKLYLTFFFLVTVISQVLLPGYWMIIWSGLNNQGLI